MGKYLRILKTLRDIALEHAAASPPDLACMARDLGREARLQSHLFAHHPRLHQHHAAPAHWSLARRGRGTVEVCVVAWPAGHFTALHAHDAGWSLHVPLVGALELHSYRRGADGELSLHRRDWLGSGDGCWFEADQPHWQRCRNLSRHDTAFSLMVYGGSEQRPFTRTIGADRPSAAEPLLGELTGHLYG